MAISLKTRIMIWGRAASRCSFPECQKELVMDATETDDESLIGDICHIVADSEDGPRGKSSLSDEQRDKFSNLTLMCKNHHKIIDDQKNTYTVAKLTEIKENHEKWVRSSLTEFDMLKQKDHEVYATYIEELAQRARFANWTDLTIDICSRDQPQMSKSLYHELEELRGWMLSRIWPKRYPLLESAFNNFRLVLSDLQLTFMKYAEAEGSILITRKIYQIPQWDTELYAKLAKEYNEHVGIVDDLMLELTRAANYLFDKVREFLDSSYRIQEGVLLVETGIDTSLKAHVIRPEYYEDERVDSPYPGLEAFKTMRYKRDISFGESRDAQK